MRRVEFQSHNFVWIEDAFLKSIWLLGIQGKERFQYWKLILWTLGRRPHFIGISISLAIYGFHFRKIAGI